MAGIPTMNFKTARYRYATSVKWGNGYDPTTDMKYLNAKSIADALEYYGCKGARITVHSLQVRCKDGRWRFGDDLIVVAEEAERVAKRGDRAKPVIY